MEGRHNLGRGTLVVLDVIPESGAPTYQQQAMLESLIPTYAVFSDNASRPVPYRAVLRTPAKSVDSNTEGLQETRAVRSEIEERKAAPVTELLANLKTSNPPKGFEALKPRPHAAFQTIERQKPCVVMKRTRASSEERTHH